MSACALSSCIDQVGGGLWTVRRCSLVGKPLRRTISRIRLEQSLPLDGTLRPAFRILGSAQRLHRPPASFAQSGHFKVPRFLFISQVSDHFQLSFSFPISTHPSNLCLFLSDLHSLCVYKQVLQRPQSWLYPRLDSPLRRIQFYPLEIIVIFRIYFFK